MNQKLAAAILLWKRGQPIDTALHSQIAAQGYDVASLERRYRA
jgi:hypothetical protein